MNKEQEELKSAVHAHFALPKDATVPVLMQGVLVGAMESTEKDYAFILAQVETNLSAAEALIGRSTADKQLYDSLAEKALTQALTIDEFFRQDEVRQKEFDAGLHEVSYLEALAAKNIHDLQLDSLKQVQLTSFQIASQFYSNPAIDQNVNDSSWLAWAGKMVFFHDTSKTGAPRVLPPQSGVNEGDLAQGVFDLTKRQTAKAQTQQKLQADLADKTATAQLNEELQKTDSITKKLDFTSKFKAYQIDRANISRSLVYKKVRLIDKRGSPINYVEQQQIVKQRVVADAQIGNELVKATDTGLRAIFGISIENPPLFNERFLTEATIWLRKARLKLDVRLQQDQSFVAVFSLKEFPTMAGIFTYSNAVGKFAISTKLIPPGYEARILGVSASVRAKESVRAFTLKLTAPPEGVHYHLGGKESRLPQKYTPLYIGRVRNWSPYRDPDICGLQSFRNISPFGEWQLSVEPEELSALRVEKVTDIEIEFHIALQSAPEVLP